jgi:hypothetical protein
MLVVEGIVDIVKMHSIAPRKECENIVEKTKLQRSCPIISRYDASFFTNNTDHVSW